MNNLYLLKQDQLSYVCKCVYSCSNRVKILPAGGVAELVSGSVTVTTGECCSRDNFLSTGLDDLRIGLSDRAAGWWPTGVEVTMDELDSRLLLPFDWGVLSEYVRTIW